MQTSAGHTEQLQAAAHACGLCKVCISSRAIFSVMSQQTTCACYSICSVSDQLAGWQNIQLLSTSLSTQSGLVLKTTVQNLSELLKLQHSITIHKTNADSPPPLFHSRDSMHSGFIPSSYSMLFAEHNSNHAYRHPHIFCSPTLHTCYGLCLPSVLAVTVATICCHHELCCHYNCCPNCTLKLTSSTHCRK